MRDVARQAGVSASTVSLALRNDRRLPQTTRDRLVKLAKKMGYEPHPLISALSIARRSHRTTESGAVLAFVEYADRPEDARPEHFDGARKAAEEQGYKLEPFVVGAAGLSPERLNGVLLARNIHGVLIAPLPRAHGHFQLDWKEFCVVVLEYTFNEPRFDRVVGDIYASMRLILEKCRDRGLNRVGLLFTENGRERTEGLNEGAYWMEQKADGYFAPVSPLSLDRWDDRTMARWFNKNRPQALITSNTLLGGITDFLRHQHLHNPQDIALINVNRLPGLHSQVSGIDQNAAFMGATAVRMLIDKLNRNDRGVPAVANSVLVPGTWVDHESLLKKNS